MNKLHELSFEQFCNKVIALTGFSLTDYRPVQMERRIRAYARRKGADSLADFLLMLRGQPVLRQNFVDYLTINVTNFFRDAERFEELATFVLPVLLAECAEPLIWSAGCANGAEAYTIAMLLERLRPQGRYRILATDINHQCLQATFEGVYGEEALREAPEDFQREYFTPLPDGRYQAQPALRAHIDCVRHDLLRDQFPRNVDLILCRNVVIYLTPAAKMQLYPQFFRALRPGGYLMLGNTERILEADKLGFLNSLPHLYQRRKVHATHSAVSSKGS